MINKIKKYLSSVWDKATEDPEFNGNDNIFDLVLSLFMMIFYGISSVIIVVFTICTFPFWIIPYLIYKANKN